MTDFVTCEVCGEHHEDSLTVRDGGLIAVYGTECMIKLRELIERMPKGKATRELKGCEEGDIMRRLLLEGRIVSIERAAQRRREDQS